jgi:hypothetical protein
VAQKTVAQAAAVQLLVNALAAGRDRLRQLIDEDHLLQFERPALAGVWLIEAALPRLGVQPDQSEIARLADRLPPAPDDGYEHSAGLHAACVMLRLCDPARAAGLRPLADLLQKLSSAIESELRFDLEEKRAVEAEFDEWPSG